MILLHHLIGQVQIWFSEFDRSFVVEPQASVMAKEIEPMIVDPPIQLVQFDSEAVDRLVAPVELRLL